jgi:hypothetical protein
MSDHIIASAGENWRCHWEEAMLRRANELRSRN